MNSPEETTSTARNRLETTQQSLPETLEALVQERTARLEQTILELKDQIKQKQQIESSLRSSEQRYQLLYEYNPFMYFTLLPDGTVVSVNHFGADQLGYRKEDLIGRSILTLFEVKDRQTILDQLQACAAQPYTLFQWNIQKARRDGRKLWVKERACAVHDHANELVVLISCEDITEHRQAEEQLRDNEVRWRAFYEHAGVGIAQLDLTGRFLRVNPKLCETLGYSSDAMLQRTFQEFTHPDDLATNLTYLNELLTNTRPAFTMEKRYRRDDNTWLWVELTVSLIRAASGAPAYFIAVIQNIHDRKTAEQHLCDSEQAIRSLLEATSRPGLTLDERIQTVLELGCRRLWLPIGLVTGTHGDRLTLRHVWAPSTTLEPGMHFPLHQTYCGETLKSKSLLSIEQAHPSSWVRRPGFETLGFESYIGTPLMDREQVHGTICFAGPEPYPRRFSQADKDFVQLMARWVSGELLRYESEQAVKEQEALLRSVIETATDAIFMKDRDGRYRFVNTASARTIGKTQAEIIGKRDDELLPRETAIRSMTVDQQVLTGLAPRSFEDSVTFNGTSQIFATIKTPHRDQSGRVVGLVGVARDMTAVKQTEEALRISEERFKIAFRASPHPVIITELASGRCLEVNEASLKLFGYERDEVIGQTTIMLGIWPTLDDRAQFFQQLREKGTVRNRELSLRTKDRKIRELLVSSEVIELNGTSCLITVGNDITEHKRAEQALRESELRLQRFVAEAPVGLCILDENWRAIIVNRALCELTGYEPDELVGSTYALYTHPEDLPANIQLTDEFYQGLRSSYTYEKRYIRKSGEIIWVSVKATRIELAGHQGPLLLAAVQDITERKHAMEEREQLSRDLHDNLLQALYAVGMQLEASKLSMGRSPRRSKMHITQAIRQLNGLMVDVRRFITLLTERTSVQTDFGQSLHELVDSMTNAEGVAAELDVKKPALAFITPQIGAHLLNIAREALSNSLRHARASHRWVHLSLAQSSIRLSVGDDGIGFSPARKRRSGRGLANMAARAQRLTASFTLDSIPGRGTTITIDVPLQRGNTV